MQVSGKARVSIMKDFPRAGFCGLLNVGLFFLPEGMWDEMP